MAERRLAFDHAGLIARAVESTRAEVERLELPAGLVPDQFTLGELRSTCEQQLGRKLDKSSFRWRLADRDLVVPVAGLPQTGTNQPAWEFRLRAG